MHLGSHHSGQPRDRALRKQFLESRPNTRQCVSVTDGEHTPVGGNAARLLDDFISDGLVALDAQGVAANDRRLIGRSHEPAMAFRCFGKQSPSIHLVGERQNRCAVLPDLRQHRFSGPAKRGDDTTHARAGRVSSERGAGVAGRSRRHDLCPLRPGHRHCNR